MLLMLFEKSLQGGRRRKTKKKLLKHLQSAKQASKQNSLTHNNDAALA